MNIFIGNRIRFSAMHQYARNLDQKFFEEINTAASLYFNDINDFYFKITQQIKGDIND